MIMMFTYSVCEQNKADSTQQMRQRYKNKQTAE